MKEHNDDPKLQQLLSEKLEEHTIPAPDFIWPAIEKELFPPARKRRPFFWWFVFTGLFLGTLSFSYIFLFPANHIDFSFVGAPVPMSQTMKPLQPIESTTTGNKATSNNITASNTIHNTQPALSGSETENNSSLFNSTQQHQTSKTTKKRNNKHRNTTGNDQEMQTNQGANPVAKSTHFLTSIVGSLIVRTEQNGKLIDSVLTPEKPRDELNDLAFSMLLPKTIDHFTDTIPSIAKVYHPNPFIPYSFIGIYAGVGKNNRTYSGIVETNSKAFIIDRTLHLKNSNFGLDYNYQFLRFASVRVGINHGTNRYTTRLFPVRIANTALNDELELSSPSGELKSAPLDLADQASPILDTTTFLMRIIHRSQYITIPLSIRFNTFNAIGPQVYGYTGFDFVFRGKDLNTLVVRKSFTERSFSTSKPRSARGFYPGWHLGLGISSNPVRKLQVYGEFNYSQVFGNYYTGKIISIRSNNVQLNVGLRINL